MVLTDSQIGQYAYNAGFRGEDLAVAVAITHPESGGDPGAIQPDQPPATTGWGLWQITPGDSSLLDPQANANAAFAKYKAANGFSPWTTYEDGKYKQYLDAARSAVAKLVSTSPGGSQSTTGPLSVGSGLLKGKQTDPWGIGQGITDAVGGTGSVLGGIGRNIMDSATLGVGLLIIAAGVGILGWMFINNTQTGRGIKRVGKDVAVAAAVVPK